MGFMETSEILIGVALLECQFIPAVQFFYGSREFQSAARVEGVRIGSGDFKIRNAFSSKSVAGLSYSNHRA